MRKSQRVQFPSAQNIQLSGIIDSPSATEGTRSAVFAHCFTCTKDLKAIVRISRRLAELGFTVLRFDFTGLGGSGGHFSQTDFRTNIDDVLSAARYLEQASGRGPDLLIGHSLGGAAQIAACPQIASARGVVTLASPSNTHHLARFLHSQDPRIASAGEGRVTIGGREYRITRTMLETLEQHDQRSALERQTLPHLVFHSPQDETLPMSHALEMLEYSAGPCSLVNLHGSDHLFVNKQEDCDTVAEITCAWSQRLLRD